MKKTALTLLILLFVSIYVFSLGVSAYESESLVSETESTATVTDKIFQSASLGIMTIGIIGLPVYFILNMRKKRLMQEYEEENDEKKHEDNQEIE